jgi:hypothetical protein
VRLGNYKKQQAAAMALYKAKAKTPYYFWAVMSIVLQVGQFGIKQRGKNRSRSPKNSVFMYVFAKNGVRCVRNLFWRETVRMPMFAFFHA